MAENMGPRVGVARAIALWSSGELPQAEMDRAGGVSLQRQSHSSPKRMDMFSGC